MLIQNYDNIGSTARSNHRSYLRESKTQAERDEAREKYDLEATEHMLAINKICNERDQMREVLMVIEDRCVDCEDACDDIQKIRDTAREALEK